MTIGHDADVSHAHVALNLWLVAAVWCSPIFWLASRVKRRLRPALALVGAAAIALLWRLAPAPPPELEEPTYTLSDPIPAAAPPARAFAPAARDRVAREPPADNRTIALLADDRTFRELLLPWEILRTAYSDNAKATYAHDRAPAMAPSLHLNSGAISPAESETNGERT